MVSSGDRSRSQKRSGSRAAQPSPHVVRRSSRPRSGRRASTRRHSADPPWKPEEGGLDPTRAIENQYPTQTLAELITHKPQIDALAADNCVLFLWAVPAKLHEAMALIEAWGFVVKSGAVSDQAEYRHGVLVSGPA